MKDKPKTKGWVGVDLDGTLARFDGWKGIDHIGEPIIPMVRFVRFLVAKGIPVRVFTARVAPRDEQTWMINPYYPSRIESKHIVWSAEDFVKDWIRKNIGYDLPVTCVKDGYMICFFDDRAVSVGQNEGSFTNALPPELQALLSR